MKGRPRQWLLIKQRDEEARPGFQATEEWTTSVLSGRSIEDLERQVAAGSLKMYRCG
jgi:hypothetical protein